VKGSLGKGSTQEGRKRQESVRYEGHVYELLTFNKPKAKKVHSVSAEAKAERGGVLRDFVKREERSRNTIQISLLKQVDSFDLRRGRGESGR